MLVEAVRGLARSEASPGGGLLEAHGVRAAFLEAVAAATERSRQLGA